MALLPILIGTVAIVALSGKKKNNNTEVNASEPVNNYTPSAPLNPTQNAASGSGSNNTSTNTSRPKPRPSTSSVTTPVRNALISSAISAAAGSLKGVDDEYSGFYANKLL